MSQNHINSDGIPGRGHLDESLPNTMGQYHGGYPWFCTFFLALLPIRDLERCFPRAYATPPKKIRVYLETYSFHQDLAHAEILSSFPSVHTSPLCQE